MKPTVHDGDHPLLKRSGGLFSFLYVSPVCFLLLVFQGSQGVLQAIGQDFQLLGQLVLLAELLAQQHQVARGVVQRDVAQVQPPAGQVVQVHHAGKREGKREVRSGCLRCTAASSDGTNALDWGKKVRFGQKHPDR